MPGLLCEKKRVKTEEPSARLKRVLCTLLLALSVNFKGPDLSPPNAPYLCRWRLRENFHWAQRYF